MNKISSQDASALLKKAGAAIRSLTAHNAELQEKIASRDREDRIHQVARDMEDKGLSPDLTIEEKVASLRKAQDLNVTEEAVKLAAPQGSGLGSVGEVPGNGVSAFESYILTGED